MWKFGETPVSEDRMDLLIVWSEWKRSYHRSNGRRMVAQDFRRLRMQNLFTSVDLENDVPKFKVACTCRALAIILSMSDSERL